ncbi:transposase [Kribbella sp. NPDC003557]|uniref:RNA-guided endonuclease InsQ/TnpB family protein n=1 Tax=Kribbella sp. NPDC003557 TaxID=3154449 RepID=UPI0033B0957F
MSRYRLNPTMKQVDGLLKHCEHARYLWNLALEQWGMWVRERGPTPGFVEQCRQLTEARVAEAWLAEGSQTVQQQALRDFDQARKRYFDGANRRPTWRRAGVHEGFRIVGPAAQRVEKLNRKWGRVLVPKVGWVRFRLTRALPAAKSYRITLDRVGRWHIAFAAIPRQVTGPGTGGVVGIDRGTVVSAALSTGELLSCPGLTRRERARVEQLQRGLARSTRGGSRHAKIKAAIARLRAREVDRRTNWVEHTTTDLARRFDVIRVEDLKIRAMTTSARGTIEQPGRHVRRKAGLNRSILASGWGKLVARLEQKAPGRVEKVSPAYTSLICSLCGHCAPESRESQAIFRCVVCRYQLNADVNAARNIAAGRAVIARRETSVSAKREPQPAASP